MLASEKKGVPPRLGERSTSPTVHLKAAKRQIAYELGKGFQPLSTAKGVSSSQTRVFTRGNEKTAGKVFSDYAIVLDIVTQPGNRKKAVIDGPLLQLIGENHFTLLEATPKADTHTGWGERIYIGKDKPREKVDHILGRISYKNLTGYALHRLRNSDILVGIIEREQEKVVNFFNTAKPVSRLRHELERIGITKEQLSRVLTEKDRSAFTSLDDIITRTGITDLKDKVAKRVLTELSW